MDTLGKRLKHTRKLLRYSLENFAALGGIGKSTQDRYERDERVPDSGYFNALKAKDPRINMFWIMQGDAGDDDPDLEPSPITGPEFQLLKNFRIATEADQLYLLNEAEKCANNRFKAVADGNAIASTGADIQYIVTGVRSTTALVPDEQVLLDGYRELDAPTKRRMLAFVLTEAGPVAIRKKIKEMVAKQEQSQQTITATGKGAQAAGRDIKN